MASNLGRLLQFKYPIWPLLMLVDVLLPILSSIYRMRTRSRSVIEVLRCFLAFTGVYWLSNQYPLVLSNFLSNLGNLDAFHVFVRGQVAVSTCK